MGKHINEVDCEWCKKIFYFQKKRKIYLCQNCQRQKSAQEKLAILKSTLVIKNSKYHQYLFDLYFKYLDRFKLTKQILDQVNNFKKILEENNLPIFTSWIDIFKESKKYRELYGRPRCSGCPFIKTGHMLQELGVLPPKTEETSIYFESVFEKLSEDSLKKIKPFIDELRTGNLAPITIVRILEILVKFNLWLEKKDKGNLLLANANVVQQYLKEVSEQGFGPSLIEQIIQYLGKYYRWCKNKKMIFFNPCGNIKYSRRAPRLIICSEFQCNKLFSFIKNETSSPEQALILALILIWGLKSEDLRFAIFDFDGQSLTLTLRRRPLTGSKRFYNRNQILKLPIHPKWLQNLQINFYQQWTLQYAILKKNYPHQYLLLPKGRFVRPLTKGTLLERIYRGTKSAVGERITAQVLRKTCGHLHTLNNDASILSSLGWSSEYSFDYTWMPRSYFSRDYKKI